ncbi:MAG: aminopeptidase P family N-terminal domain-containing protein, partial [Deltaproteobacteria bacterium]|nr:aminopeptidase P family N-terminal domain-containing protein [Deltaproteobacteria bacterium]
METMQPTLRIGRNVWDRVNLPETEFQERIERIKEKMKKQGIDVLFLYSSGFNEYGNACYLTNFVVRLPQGTLVAVPQDGEITLFFEGSSRMLPTVKKTVWVEDITACRDVSQEMVKYLKENNLIPSKIGFAGIRQLMPYNQYQFLSESLDQCEIVDVDQIIKDMRMVKSSREQD